MELKTILYWPNGMFANIHSSFYFFLLHSTFNFQLLTFNLTIGIYGGSYNPIHIGHTSLAQSLVQQGLVDEVWLLVSPLNPLKQDNRSEFADYSDRLRMAELACEECHGLRVSDFENHLPIPSYMVNTLAELQKAYPEHTFSLVIGADNWESFHRWYKSDEIISKYDILVYNRPGYELDEANLPDSVKVVDTPLYDISSTQIREAIKKGEMPLEWLSPNVAKFIQDRKLYSLK